MTGIAICRITRDISMKEEISFSTDIQDMTLIKEVYRIYSPISDTIDNVK